MISAAPTQVSPLYAELHRWKTLPFEWGVCDCCLVLADWVWRVRGQDPAAHIRGLYDGPASCQRLTGFIRTPEAAIEACAQTIGGLPRPDVPAPGDVAAVRRLDQPDRPFGMLWTGQHWVAKAPEGVTILSPQVVQATAVWGVGYA